MHDLCACFTLIFSRQLLDKCMHHAVMTAVQTRTDQRVILIRTVSVIYKCLYNLLLPFYQLNPYSHENTHSHATIL